MTTLCISGSPAQALTRVAQQLKQSGVAESLPLQRDPSITLQLWHQRVSAMQESGSQPGRLWEQLAVDLMLANIDAPIWAWADVQSVNFLDFWIGLGVDIRFVLMCQTRQQAIAHLLDEPTNGQLVADALADWENSHQLMLRFHLRHPEQSLLVWADQAQAEPEALITEINHRWHLALQAQPLPAAVFEPINPVAQQLVGHIVALYPALEELGRELLSTVTLLHDESTVLEVVPTVDALIKSYGQLLDRSQELAAVALARTHLAEEVKAKAEVLAKCVHETKVKLEAQAQLKAAQGEGELLLLQLHQVQEELESNFLQLQDSKQEVKKLAESAQQLAVIKQKVEVEAQEKTELQKKLLLESEAKIALVKDKATLVQEKETLAQEKKALGVARDAEASAKTAALAQRDHETKAKVEAQAQLKAAQGEGELLLLQLHQVQEELESNFLQLQDSKQEVKKLAESAQQLAVIKQKVEVEAQEKTELQKKLLLESEAKIALVKDKATLVQEKETLAQEKKALGVTRDAEANAKTAALAQLKAAQSEGELLLVQLHQVQEELESYYLKHKDAQSEVNKLADRWTRLLKAQPDLCDFDSIEILEDRGAGQALGWRLNNATLAGRFFDQLEFSTVEEEGVAGFVMKKAKSGASPLLRWPVSAKKDQELTVIPVKDRLAPQRRAAHLVQLSASDWALMRALPDVLIKAIERKLLPLEQTRQQKLHDALVRYSMIMDTVKGLVRFDQAIFTGQQNTVDREVLSIQLNKVHFANQTIAKFDFQLQINKSLSGSTDSAHFIFDENTAAAPIHSWSSNVTSTAGLPVMAVRLDASGWMGHQGPSLTSEDQSFMAALVDSLPIIFIQLQESGIRSERQWKDWVQEATKLRQWSRQIPGQGAGSSVEADASDMINDQTSLTELATEPEAGPLSSKRPKVQKEKVSPQPQTPSVALVKTTPKPEGKPKRKPGAKLSRPAPISLPAPAAVLPAVRTAKKRAR